MALAIREVRNISGAEIVVVRPDGSRTRVLAFPELIFNADGSLAGAVNVLVDVTHRYESGSELGSVREELEQRVQERTAELTRANEALQTSESFAHAALDALSANICVLDEHGVIIAVNRAWRDFANANLPAGIDQLGESELGADYLAACDAATDNEDATAFAVGIRDVMSGKCEEFVRDYPCHSPTERRWFQGRVTALPGPTPTRVIVAHSDITERKLAEEALQRAHASLSLAQSASGSGLWDWDGKTGQLFVSPEFRKLLGFSATISVTWETWMEVIFLEDRGRVLEAMRALFASGRDFHLEYRLIDPGPEERWIEATGTLCRDAKGRPSRFTGIALDVSARKRAEAKLRWKAELLELAHDAIHVWDSEGKVQYWNRGCTDLYGYTPHEAIGRTIHELLQTRFPFPRSFVEAELQRVGRWVGELHQMTKSGEEVVVSSRLQLVSGPGKPSFTLGTHRDVTQQRQLKQRVLDATAGEQERIARDLHDSICQELDATELLTRVLKVKIGPNAAALSDLEKISSNLRETIAHTQMLAQGLSPVNLGGKGLMTAIEALAEQTRELFHVDCCYTREQTILVPDNTRATHLYRIVQEAISNAIRHGQAREIRIRFTQTGSTATLAVHDNGIGIPQEVASSSGMGLHTMRHHAETIGGTLQVRRGGKKGTVVVCTFAPDA